MDIGLRIGTLGGTFTRILAGTFIGTFAGTLGILAGPPAGTLIAVPVGTLGIPAGTLAGTSAGIQMGTVPLPFGGTFPELLEEGTTGGTGGGTTFSEPLGCVLGLDFLGNFFFFERHPNHNRITNTTIITPMIR